MLEGLVLTLPYAQNLPGTPSTFCREGGLGLWSSLHPLMGAPPGATHSAISSESRKVGT